MFYAVHLGLMVLSIRIYNLALLVFVLLNFAVCFKDQLIKMYNGSRLGRD
jgi:hypothetical protein